jgi:hypothetical protein
MINISSWVGWSLRTFSEKPKGDLKRAVGCSRVVCNPLFYVWLVGE